MRTWSAKFLMAAVLMGAGSISQAEEADELVRQGDLLDGQLKTAEALERYLAADRLRSNDPEILYRIAKQYGLSMNDAGSKEGKLKAAKASLEFAKRAVAANAKHAKSHLALAIAYGRIAPLLDNKTKIAFSKLVKEHAETALELDPTDDLTHHVLGVWHYELANLNGLLRAVAQLVYGKLPAASNDRAVKYFQKAIELAPRKVAPHVELGRAYAALGSRELARASLRKGLSLPSREKDDEEVKRRAREALEDL